MKLQKLNRVTFHVGHMRCGTACQGLTCMAHWQQPGADMPATHLHMLLWTPTPPWPLSRRSDTSGRLPMILALCIRPEGRRQQHLAPANSTQRVRHMPGGTCCHFCRMW